MDTEYFSLIPIIRNSYGIVLTLLSTLGLYLFSQKLKYGSNIPLKAQSTYFETWYWSSYIVSIIHAGVVGVLALLCVLINRKLMYEIDHYFEPSYWVICFSAGYFIYDLWDEIAHKNHTTIAQYVVHHVLVLTVLLPCVFTGRFIGIATTGLVTEFHNVFLHSRIVISFYDYEHKPKLKNSLGIANLVTCIMFRLILFPWIAVVVSRSNLSTPILIGLYAELVYIFLYSLYIFFLSLRTDFPTIVSKVKVC